MQETSVLARLCDSSSGQSQPSPSSKSGSRGAQLGPVLPFRGGTAPEQLPSALQLSDVN